MRNRQNKTIIFLTLVAALTLTACGRGPLPIEAAGPNDAQAASVNSLGLVGFSQAQIDSAIQTYCPAGPLNNTQMQIREECKYVGPGHVYWRMPAIPRCTCNPTLNECIVGTGYCASQR